MALESVGKPYACDLSCQHIREGVSGLASDVPVLHDGGNFIHPRHCDGISGDVHHDKVRIGGGKGGYHLILSVRETVLETVGSLSVLMVTLVEAAYEYHHVGRLGRGNGVGKKLRS